MASYYKIPEKIIEKIIDNLKTESYMPKDKVFNYEMMDNPSNEIYYNDYGFLDAVGHYQIKDTMDDIALLLKQKGYINKDWEFNKQIFDMYGYRVKNSFVVPWKSFTPAMENLAYMISLVKQPHKVLCVGGNCGYTLAWLMGCFWKSSNRSDNVMYAIEKNASLLEITEKNLSGLKLNCDIKYMSGDAYDVLNNIEADDFDLVFLDTRRDIRILKKLYEKMKKTGWLLMHNASDPHFDREMKPFLEFVRDPELFEDSILFSIDSKGMELSIKR